MSKFRLPRHESDRFKKLRRIAFTIPISLTLIMSTRSTAFANEPAEAYGSVMTQRAARSGANAIKKGDWKAASTEFRRAIGFDPQQEDFYFGLYESSRKAGMWEQAVFALEELFSKNPKWKNKLLREYGEALSHVNRLEESKAVLKGAITNSHETSIVEQRLKTLMERSSIVLKSEADSEYKEPEKFVRPEREGKLDQKDVHEESSKRALTFLNAFMKCEGVFIAEYKGYEHTGPVTYYKPPKANYKIDEFLKGPPLSRTLPVKFEFHEKLKNAEKPKDWKFSEEMMPLKGSKWIIFIPTCVPINGQFETFHGSYGRQEYNEKNLDDIHRIIQEHEGQAK